VKQDDLIIELPHLQSLSQRVGSWFVSLACWSLWIYFLIPLVSLGGWLMGVRKFSAEVRWFGGYKSLIELLELYGYTILVILLIWTIWTLIRSAQKPNTPQSHGLAPATEIPQALVKDPAEILEAQSIRNLTVHFDDQGIIQNTRVLNAKEPTP
jgi:poly-beta-1,6-N-acetyl-D-glucosamine biosynthesis protein PgaD